MHPEESWDWVQWQFFRQQGRKGKGKKGREGEV